MGCSRLKKKSGFGSGFTSISLWFLFLFLFLSMLRKMRIKPKETFSKVLYKQKDLFSRAKISKTVLVLRMDYSHLPIMYNAFIRHCSTLSQVLLAHSQFSLLIIQSLLMQLSKTTPNFPRPIHCPSLSHIRFFSLSNSVANRSRQDISGYIHMNSVEAVLS